MRQVEIQQRTKEWFELRTGRATGSEISKILGIKTFGLTGESYAYEKACEMVFGLPDEEESFESFDMIRGRELEPLAFNKFKELKEFDFLDVSETTFIPYGEYAGASPDGFVSDNSSLEIKCPRRNKFFRYIAFGKDEISKEYYSQMQMQMLCAKTDRTYYFNYYIDNGFEMWHEIVVERDEEHIDFIKSRLDMFKEKRDSYIDSIKKNMQFVF
ncbi:lambda exonuclease family protein [Paenimyroides ceti]